MNEREAEERWNAWHVAGGPKYPHEKVVQFCFRHYPPDARPLTRALDLGCGSGCNTVFLAREGFAVTGTDISAGGIDKTKERLAQEGLGAELRVEGADVVNFPGGSFDLIVCVGVFDASGPAVAKRSVPRAARALKAGGLGLFLFASEEDFRVRGENPLGLHGYARAEVQEMFGGEFGTVHIDRYVTTYEGERIQQADWLVTVRK